MTSRRRVEERILKKEQEIQELEMQVREARAYIQALQDVAKFLPRDGETGNFPPDSEVSLREGSLVDKARKAIIAAGRPLHVAELLRACGRENNRKNRIGMSGSLAAYVRKNEIFTRPRPGTYGLIAMGEPVVTPQHPAHSGPPTSRSVPPDDFGIGDEDSAQSAS
jgi:hypothetical protein